METKKITMQSLFSSRTHKQFSFVITLVHSNGYGTGFMSHVLCLYSCTVVCNYVFSMIDQHSCGKRCYNLVSSRVRESGHKTSCNLAMRVIHLVLEQSQCSYSCSLVPRPYPTSSIDCLQYMKQMMASQVPGYNSLIPNHCCPQYLPLQKYFGGGGWQRPGNEARLAKQNQRQRKLWIETF